MELPLWGREEKLMKKQETLAKKLLEQANELTRWNFQISKNDDVYFVETMICNNAKGKIFATFKIADWYVLLKIWSPECRYDSDFVYKKLVELSCGDRIVNKYGIYSTTFGKDGMCLNTPIPLEVMENNMVTVVKGLMINMIGTMAEIIF